MHFLLWEVMVQAGWRRKFGRQQELLCWSDFGQRYSEDHRTQIYFLFAASVQRTTEVRHEEMARTCSDSGCRSTQPIFYRISESYTAGGGGNFEMCFVTGGCGRRGCVKDSALGGEQRECFDLNEGEKVPEKEEKVKPWRRTTSLGR